MPEPSSHPILQHVSSNELLQITSSMAGIPSFTGEETALAIHLHELFSQHGVDSELTEVGPGRMQVVGRIPGSGGGSSLMLNGHIDMEPLYEGMRRDPWTAIVEGDRLYGAGIPNMKAGVAAMVLAAIAIKRSGMSLSGDVLVACVAGELQGGIGTLHLLKSGVRADAAVVPEPQIPPGTAIITKHCGVVQFAVHVSGLARHTAVQEEGVNALVKGIRAYEALQSIECHLGDDANIPGLPRFNVGAMNAGRGRGLEGVTDVPDRCSIFVDVRHTAQTRESIRECVLEELEKVRRSDPEFRYELEFPLAAHRDGALHQAMQPLDVSADERIVRTVAKHSAEVTGREPKVGAKLPDSYYSSDAGHLASAGIPSCEYGPAMVVDENGADRWISMQEHLSVARVLALTVVDFCS